MHNISFSWNVKKETGNYKKHGVRFSEAETVFYDENAKEYREYFAEGRK
jgi:uncharacterized DUF497 family protein